MGYINGKEAVFPGSLFILFIFRVPFGKCGYLLYFTLILCVVAIYEMSRLYFIILAFCASSLLCSKIVHRQR